MASLFSLLVAFGVVVRVAAAPVWVSPPTQQPGGNIAPPLNTSLQPQTKKGGLTIEGTVNIAAGENLTIGPCSSGACRICWNGACRSGWGDVVSTANFLTLKQSGTTTDSGYLELNQTGLGVATVSATVTGSAGLSTSALPTYGIHAKATNGGGYSTGVAGFAVNGASGNSIGIYADAGGFPNAWAGFFRGDVVVSNMDGAGKFDLVIGGGAASGNGIAEICLAGVCQSTWPAPGGTGVWALSGNFLLPKNDPRSIAFAGTGPEAPFFVNVNGATAKLKVRGSAQFDQFVVGTPSVIPPVTCGDGWCTAQYENDVYCENPYPGCRSPIDYYCPQDCDLTPPGNAVPWEAMEGGLPCPPEGCPSGQTYLQIAWTNPNDPDLFKTRLIVRTNGPPTGLDDNDPLGSGFVFAQDYNPSEYMVTNISCSQALNYYAGLYPYDNKLLGEARHFATGVTFGPLLCTDQPVVWFIPEG